MPSALVFLFASYPRLYAYLLPF